MSSMYVVIGAPGMGKSPFAQKMIEGRKCLVFDVQNEYGLKTKYIGQKAINLSSNVNDPRARFIGFDIKTFTLSAMKRIESVIIMEEATAFFRGKQSQLTSQLVIGRKHTKNVLVFLFHSINRVPPEIMEMCEYVVLLKTNDEERIVKHKYFRLYPYFMELQGKPNGEKIIIKML